MPKAKTNTSKDKEMYKKAVKRVSELEIGLARVAIKLEAMSKILLDKGIYDNETLQKESAEMVRLMYDIPKSTKLIVKEDGMTTTSTTDPTDEPKVVRCDADCYEIDDPD